MNKPGPLAAILVVTLFGLAWLGIRYAVSHVQRFVWSYDGDLVSALYVIGGVLAAFVVLLLMAVYTTLGG